MVYQAFGAFTGAQVAAPNLALQFATAKTVFNTQASIAMETGFALEGIQAFNAVTIKGATDAFAIFQCTFIDPWICRAAASGG